MIDDHLFRTGTEEQQTRRGELIQEVILIQEAETPTINSEFGAENDTEDEIFCHSLSKKSDKSGKKLANSERDIILDKSCNFVNYGANLIM